VSAGDPGRGCRGVVAVIFALWQCFGAVVGHRESSGRAGGRLGRDGFRRRVRLECVVEVGAMKGIWCRKACWRRKSAVGDESVAVFERICSVSPSYPERRGRGWKRHPAWCKD